MYLLRCCALLLFCSRLFHAGASTGGPYTRQGGPVAADSLELPLENDRVVSGVLALALGPFGAHRIYLGTTPKVVVLYGLTFGGFGVLALADLAHLLFSKDLEPYRNNDRVIMWGRPRERLTPR